MSNSLGRRSLLTVIIMSMLVLGFTVQSLSAKKVKLRLATSASPTGTRGIALKEKFGPGVSSFAEFEPHWNSSLFKQGTELEAIARGNLEMALASAQEIAVYIPEFSIFATGYVHRDAKHQVAVFKNSLMKPFKKKVEKKLKMKLLSVIYLGRRQVNLRTSKKVMTPKDLRGVKLRMPGTDAWQFLGKALGASPVPMAFSEVYTGLQTGAVDGQDNPLPTVVDKKFYEVTKQIILTSHLVDLNYLAISMKTWNSLSSKEKSKLQAAADRTSAYGRKKQLEAEASDVKFLKGKGLKIYEPNLKAFRDRVQKMYLDSEYSKVWPKGVLKKINSL